MNGPLRARGGIERIAKLLVAQPFAVVPNAAAALGWKAARRPLAGLKACATRGRR